jgi:hypothetical protein
MPDDSYRRMFDAMQQRQGAAQRPGPPQRQGPSLDQQRQMQQRQSAQAGQQQSSWQQQMRQMPRPAPPSQDMRGQMGQMPQGPAPSWASSIAQGAGSFAPPRPVGPMLQRSLPGKGAPQPFDPAQLAAMIEALRGPRRDF